MEIVQCFESPFLSLDSPFASRVRSIKSLTVTNSIKQRGGSDVDLDNLIEKGSGENNTIFIIVLTFIVIGSSRESIGFTHRSSGYMGDGEVETREVQSPSSLSS